MVQMTKDKIFGEGKELIDVPAYKLDGRPSELFVGINWHLRQKDGAKDSGINIIFVIGHGTIFKILKQLCFEVWSVGELID
jgi:hypothetical protein